MAASGATAGPSARAKAGVMPSSDCWLTVWMNGNCGLMNGVVIPAISIQTSP